MSATAAARVLNGPLAEALAYLPSRMDTPEARVMLLAIGLQESRLEHRYQITTGGGVGPARGLWQFERRGGVQGVMLHRQSRELAMAVCTWRGVPWDQWEVWSRLATDDVLAAAFARLLLWTDPKALPAADHAEAAWQLYLRVWRPGRPHPATWPQLHAEARATVESAS